MAPDKIYLVGFMAAAVLGRSESLPDPTLEAAPEHITAADAMTRVYIFADDSMLGREAGTLGGVKGTQYIAGETAARWRRCAQPR